MGGMTFVGDALLGLKLMFAICRLAFGLCPA